MAKFASFDEYYASLPDDQREHIHSLVTQVAKQFDELELVIAWNQPMFKLSTQYILGFMPTKKHTNLLTLTDTVITELGDEIAGYRHGTRSISLPFDWVIDQKLFSRVVQLRLKELGLSLNS